MDQFPRIVLANEDLCDTQFHRIDQPGAVAAVIPGSEPGQARATFLENGIFGNHDSNLPKTRLSGSFACARRVATGRAVYKSCFPGLTSTRLGFLSIEEAERSMLHLSLLPVVSEMDTRLDSVTVSRSTKGDCRPSGTNRHLCLCSFAFMKGAVALP
jgi:hypothetical protein